MKIKSIDTGKSAVITDRSLDPNPSSVITEPKPQENKKLSLEYDTEENTVHLTLDNGIALKMTEPTAKTLLTVEAWLQNPKTEDDRKSTSFFLLKLAHSCSAFSIAVTGESVPKPDFETFLDWLDFDALDKVGEGIAYFQSVIDQYIRRIEKSSKQ